MACELVYGVGIWLPSLFKSSTFQKPDRWPGDVNGPGTWLLVCATWLVITWQGASQVHRCLALRQPFEILDPMWPCSCVIPTVTVKFHERALGTHACQASCHREHPKFETNTILRLGGMEYWIWTNYRVDTKRHDLRYQQDFWQQCKTIVHGVPTKPQAHSKLAQCME